ncbi:MAG: glycerophosphoryl diester phosphodiesterase membrane domain-containing protein [Gammaproteobacteria bacterium]|nr:glycerophosphoryl diester phosphodiesterase membrane domain-containing protein [Gammaproteobacteria bacterium]MBT8057520.1 glycerophosphoryl diester phosphodiesterase membrane domain-containing protein [Gammaproteobacteria bacterium]
MNASWNSTSGLLGPLKANWRPFLVIHLAVSFFVLVVLTPLSAILVRMLVLLSGDPALSDQDILLFVLSPSGFLALLVLVAVLSFIVFLEYAALVTAAWLVEKDRPAPVGGILMFLAANAPRVFGLAIWIFLRVLLFSLPFLAMLVGIYLALLGEFDINYYLAAKPGEWYTALGLAVVVLAGWAAMVLYLMSGWIFSLPLLLLGDVGPKPAIATSVEACQGRRIDILRAVLGWVLFSLALLLAGSLLTALVSWLLMPSQAGSLNHLLVSLSLASLFSLLLSFLATFIITALMALLILKLFQAFGLSRMVDSGVYARIGSARKPPIGGKAVGIISLAAAFVALVVVLGSVNQLRFEAETEVMAHRGASAAAPENTLAAISGAIESGAQWVEIDVQEAADGDIVVIHDSDLKKVGGVPMVVADSTVRELKWVDVGSWFDLSFNQERIPTLREVLDLCKDRIGVNIELKYYGSETRLEQSVAEIVDAAGMTDQVMAMSLSLPGARKMKSLRPDWKVGLLSSVSLGDLGKLDVDFLALNARVATRPLVRRLHAQGKQVFAWTVNDAVGISAMAGRGVDAIITDEPALAVNLLEHRRQLDPHERMILALAELFDRPSLLAEQ